MKGIFEIEWPDDCGQGWMNKWNLETCLRTKQFIGPKVKILVRDVTEEKPSRMSLANVHGMSTFEQEANRRYQEKK